MKAGSSISEQRPQKQSRSQDAGLVLLKRKTDFLTERAIQEQKKLSGQLVSSLFLEVFK